MIVTLLLLLLLEEEDVSAVTERLTHAPLLMYAMESGAKLRDSPVLASVMVAEGEVVKRNAFGKDR